MVPRKKGVSCNLGIDTLMRIGCCWKNCDERTNEFSDTISFLPCLRDWVQIFHVKIGKTEVDVSMQASVLAVESSVDQLRNELGGEGNNEGVGYNRDPMMMNC